MRWPGAKEERLRVEFGNLRNRAKMTGGQLDSDAGESAFSPGLLRFGKKREAVLCAKPLRTLGFQSTKKDQKSRFGL